MAETSQGHQSAVRSALAIGNKDAKMTAIAGASHKRGALIAQIKAENAAKTDKITAASLRRQLAKTPEGRASLRAAEKGSGRGIGL